MAAVIRKAADRDMDDAITPSWTAEANTNGTICTHRPTRIQGKIKRNSRL